MATIDVFNGDADGLCALHQLRLAEPRQGTLITGVKRDIDLVKQVQAQPGDSVTILDISLDKNRDALLKVLEDRGHCDLRRSSFSGRYSTAQEPDRRISIPQPKPVPA